ncbi:MAG TPA: phage tail protein [Candidatus Limnocylindrales bacterium]|nr:phage tail protein [Candidatus Limnocylindrales bacterium]
MAEPTAANGGQVAESGAQPGVWIDPYRAYNFKLVIQGITQGHFVECSGLSVHVQAIRYQEGGANVVHRIPGPIDYGDVTLRYGLTATSELWNWFMAAVQGRVERRNVSILILDTDGVTEVLRWDLINAWPSEWRGAPLDAMSREVAIESLTLVFESLQRA